MLVLETRGSCTLDWVGWFRKLPTLSHLTSSEVGRTLFDPSPNKSGAPGGRRIRGDASCD